ncbi:unnamed protein product [Calicophoron daubneyi]|uniref:Uncharacterized protein n=1 Tax=Calicophoron daubneyi TaxID=300641 RepID=A0AAV2TH16_CALDB
MLPLLVLLSFPCGCSQGIFLSKIINSVYTPVNVDIGSFHVPEAFQWLSQKWILCHKSNTMENDHFGAACTNALGVGDFSSAPPVTARDLWLAWSYNEACNWSADKVYRWLNDDVGIALNKTLFSVHQITGDLLPTILLPNSTLLESNGLSETERSLVGRKIIELIIFGPPGHPTKNTVWLVSAFFLLTVSCVCTLVFGYRPGSECCPRSHATLIAMKESLGHSKIRLQLLEHILQTGLTLSPMDEIWTESDTVAIRSSKLGVSSLEVLLCKTMRSEYNRLAELFENAVIKLNAIELQEGRWSLCSIGKTGAASLFIEFENLVNQINDSTSELVNRWYWLIRLIGEIGANDRQHTDSCASLPISNDRRTSVPDVRDPPVGNCTTVADSSVLIPRSSVLKHDKNAKEPCATEPLSSSFADDVTTVSMDITLLGPDLENLTGERNLCNSGGHESSEENFGPSLKTSSASKPNQQTSAPSFFFMIPPASGHQSETSLSTPSHLPKSQMHASLPKERSFQSHLIAPQVRPTVLSESSNNLKNPVCGAKVNHFGYILEMPTKPQC